MHFQNSIYQKLYTTSRNHNFRQLWIVTNNNCWLIWLKCRENSSRIFSLPDPNNQQKQWTNFPSYTGLCFDYNIKRPVRVEWWSDGVVTCLEWGANEVHMVWYSWCHCHPTISATVKSRMVRGLNKHVCVTLFRTQGTELENRDLIYLIYRNWLVISFILAQV